MKKILIILLLCISVHSNGQQGKTLRIGFYNVENLFDIHDDPEKQDDEFLPTGMKGWNWDRYHRKLSHLYKTILAIEGDSRLVALGLCELENCFVTRQLLESTPLLKRHFRFIQYESPDRRGVDVALAYDPEFVEPLYSRAIGIRFPFDTSGRTRDILYVKALIAATDTVHFFVNHWPSRFGGLMATVPKRNYVASVIREVCDSLLCANQSARIVIMGDLNDDPCDESVREYLMAGKGLVNLMDASHWKESQGTLKHGAAWNIFDQIIVSEILLDTKQGFRIKDGRASAVRAPFLFCDDPKAPGKKLFRTYSGMRYLGGFGDHLPVFIDVVRYNESPE